ncbi:MAG: M48 family metalloprotease [Planctomycetaceae bacterium]
MSIVINCQQCEAKFSVKDELSGKRIRCVKCQSVITVPTHSGRESQNSTDATAGKASVAERAAGGKISPAPVREIPESRGPKISEPTNVGASPRPAESAAPVIRRARRITDSEPADQSTVGHTLIQNPKPVQAAASPAGSSVASAASGAGAVRARVVAGPRDVQADAVRHTAATLSAPPEDIETLRRKVFAAFTQPKIAPVPVSGGYRFGIVLVSFFMVMLPLFYIALIGAVGWGVWYHAVNHTGMISAASGVGSGRNAGRAVVLAFLAYLAPIVAGAGLVLFMIKPLFSKPATDSGRRTLKPEDEPLLFEFVDRICKAVNSPRPRRIDIDCNINASASFNRGILSMAGNDLVLTLGMPLVAGLTMRQFGGVLAHEFGHFAQGAGMRLSYLIRSISYWFTRVVYERDAWDEKLADLSGSLDIRIGWLLYLTRFGIWLTRIVLWVLMIIGHFVSGILLRQMEFDADRHEARLAGSRTFATTARQLAVLGVAYRGALSDLGNFYREGRLGDNLPKLILLNVDQLPEKVHAKIDEKILESKTGLFDTHPADPERMASAAKEDTDGIFTLRLPAAHLFRRFDFLSRAVTWDYYKEIFGAELKKSDLHPVDKLMEMQKQQQDAWKALRRFFQGHVAWYRPMPTPTVAFKMPSRPAETLALMKKQRAAMLAAADEYGEVWKKYDAVDTELIEIGLADILLKSGLRVRRKDFSIPLTSRDEIQIARDTAERRIGKLEPKLVPFEDAAADRLYAALQIARTSQVREVLEGQGATIAELDQLLALFNHVNERLGQLLVIRDAQIAMGKLLSLLSESNDNPQLISQITDRMAEMKDHILHLRESFEGILYPFDHARADISVADYLLKSIPDGENPFELYEAADSIGNALPPMQARVTGRLCQIAEMVETHCGLPLLEDPEDDEEVDLGDDDEDE